MPKRWRHGQHSNKTHDVISIADVEDRERIMSLQMNIDGKKALTLAVKHQNWFVQFNSICAFHEQNLKLFNRMMNSLWIVIATHVFFINDVNDAITCTRRPSPKSPVHVHVHVFFPGSNLICWEKWTPIPFFRLFCSYMNRKHNLSVLSQSQTQNLEKKSISKKI